MHLHTLIWLRHAPNADEMQELLKQDLFCIKIVAYIRENIRAHLENFGPVETENLPCHSNLAYSRPLDPYAPGFSSSSGQLEREVVRLQQIHTCRQDTCVISDRYGRCRCKHRAPWPLLDIDAIEENGKWVAKQTHPYLNTYCPAITTTLKCNNNIKLVTNGCETKDATWYLTGYSVKGQNSHYNLSALLGKAVMYHQLQSQVMNDTRERAHLLLF